MSSTKPPPSSGPRPVACEPSRASPLPASHASRASEFLGAIEPEASKFTDASPWPDLDTMRDIHARARLLAPDAPQECAQGYRLIAVRDRHIAWVDIRLRRDGYAVLGSHARCDLVLAADADVWRRHLAVIAVRLEDGGLGARLIDLKTGVPFFVDDDTPRHSALTRGRFAMRLGRYVVCGVPVTFHDAVWWGTANGNAVQAMPVVDPACFSLPFQHRGTTSRAQSRLTLERGSVGAVVEVSAEALDEGIILGRARNCFDAGFDRVLSDGAISGVQVLLLRTGVELFAYDLCSTNGTRAAGRRVRRHRITSAEPTLELGKMVTLKITCLEG